MPNTGDLGPENMEDFKGELEVMPKLTLQMVSESIKECNVCLKGVADQMANLREKISHFDSFKTHTVNHQVSTKTEFLKLKKQHDEMR